jgi:NDP-sugar pyrophosphorylase family protein
MGISDIDVAVLAGGLGTRLQAVLPETPKILAPIGGKPFLEHLLGWLSRQGAHRILLCLGYRAGHVRAFLQEHSFPELDIETIVEPEPLGTGGAVAFALPHLRTDPVLVMNGDTIVDVDLNAFLAAHTTSGTDASVLCVPVEDAARYGRLEIDANRQRVIRFAEKDSSAAGSAWINGGIYLFGGKVFDGIARLTKGSLERDVLEKMPAGSIHAFQTEGRFLDIGTPETLALAPEVLTPL